MFDLLTSPEAIAQPTQSKRYFVELESKDLDWEGIPESHKLIDLCVTEEAAITVFLKAVGYLEEFRILRHWIPESCDCF